MKTEPSNWAAYEMIVRDDVGGKPVYVFERHNWALLPWAELRRKHGELRILSLDYHTDDFPAFCRHVHDDSLSNEANAQRGRLEAKKIDISDDESIKRAIWNVRHDEHVRTALASGIAEAVFVICFQSNKERPLSNEISGYVDEHMVFEKVVERHVNDEPDPPRPKRPYTYPTDKDGLYIVGSGDCMSGCDHADCIRGMRDAALETEFLSGRLAIADEMSVSATSHPDWNSLPYVLDIDLDYFNTKAAIQPRSPDLFHELIRGAVGLTVALERDCIREEQLEGEDLDADWLLERLLGHVRDAVAEADST